MDIFSKKSYDQPTIVKIIVFIDLVQSSMILLVRAISIIFRPMLSDEDAVVLRQNQSSALMVLFFTVVVSFYVFHMGMALKLLSALELMDLDPLMAARNSKLWQSWSIFMLAFLVVNLFASVVSAGTKFAIVSATLFGVCEILWRLFGMYNVGLYIDDLIAKIPTIVPSAQFFRAKMPSEPAKRVNNIKGIAGTNMVIGFLSLLYHIWSFVWVIIDPDRIISTGQTEVVVYIGIVMMFFISLGLVCVSFHLIRNIGAISSKPSQAITASKRWKRSAICCLTFFSIALMILVLSSGRQVHKGMIQKYMAFLLMFTAYTIFGIYYIGTFVTEAEKHLDLGLGPGNYVASHSEISPGLEQLR